MSAIHPKKKLWIAHLYLKPAIFEDIAQEGVSLCHLSLAASDLVENRNFPGSILDGCLFFVRHVLILKEITYNLEVDLRQRDEGKEIGIVGL